VNIWHDYGFSTSPYAPDPVPPNDQGERLFVGRAEELRRVGMLLSSAATHPTIEGDNGVGKTSLVAVASYRAQRAFEDGATTQLLIPLAQPLQLTAGDAPEEFVRRLYFAIAQAFIDNENVLRRGQRDMPNTDDVRAWLTAPIQRSGGGGGSILGAGGSFSYGSSTNTTAGFTEAGFKSAVDGWLKYAFPTPADGGFICVLDNLELLQTHKAARDLLETLRDALFSRPGLRWVLCGARGIMRAAAASPRLHGVLAEPMTLHPLDDEFVPDVVARRIEVFRTPGAEAYAPVDPDGFRHLYDVGNRNLRNALKYAEDYALWLQLEQHARPPDAEKRELLEVWMAVTADSYLADIRGVGPRAWEVFDGIVSRGGSISPADFGEFGFETPQAMRGQMQALEGSMLVETSVDETDRRRRLIEVTSKGWIVNYKRSGYKTPSELSRSEPRE